MKYLRILGILILLAGVASILFSNYITSQVSEGKAQIASGEKKVNQGKQLFSLNPVSKEVGKGLTQSADKKIEEGKQKVSYYENLAQQLQMGGIIGCVVGAGIFIASFLGSNKKRH
jgi:hypothetical protein